MSNLFGFYGFKKLKKKKVYSGSCFEWENERKVVEGKEGKSTIRCERISYLITNHFTW